MSGPHRRPHVGARRAQASDEAPHGGERQVVAVALVDEGVQREPPQRPRESPNVRARAVRAQHGGRGARERCRPGLVEVSRPALGDAEELEMMQGDVQRAVPAFGDTPDGAAGAVALGGPAAIDRAHGVEHEVLIAPGSCVRPLRVVVEALARSEGEDEEEGPDGAAVDQLVQAHGRRTGPDVVVWASGRRMQQIERREADTITHRLPVAGGQVDEVAAPGAQRGRVERLAQHAPLGDPGRVARRRKAAVGRVSIYVGVEPVSAHPEPRRRHHGEQEPAHTRARPARGEGPKRHDGRDSARGHARMMTLGPAGRGGSHESSAASAGL